MKTYRTVAWIGLSLLISYAQQAAASTIITPSRSSQAPTGGYWVLAPDRVLAYGGAPLLQERPTDLPGQGKRVITSMYAADGYWIVNTKSGELWAYGAAVDKKVCKDANGEATSNLERCSGWRANRDNDIVALTAKPDGTGLWVLTSKGQLFTVGTAQPYGDVTGKLGNIFNRRSPVDIAATPSGEGYYILMNFGQLYTFGDAKSYGDNTPVSGSGEQLSMGIALGNVCNAQGAQAAGYWIVGFRGDVSNLGSVPFYGSSAGRSRDIRGIASRWDGRGYAWARDTDGQIFYSLIGHPTCWLN
ncbi:hypothetical protein [Dyella sp. RRB7]|uniref:hypothetical protein n=1 Tax=Dyella sp. RRB7 TaxID=2919502 RepID=UPI001FAB1CE9|nr:hypothetical protein [Dyella sp. RRB7]